MSVKLVFTIYRNTCELQYVPFYSDSHVSHVSHVSCVLIRVQPGNPKLLKEFPEPKGLLNNAISRSLGVSDLSNLIQYHCTENGDVKVSIHVNESVHHEAISPSPSHSWLKMSGLISESHCHGLMAHQN